MEIILFPAKLFNILEKNLFPEFINWGENGNTIVFDASQFFLGFHKFFNYDKIETFIKTLNNYEFKRISKNTDKYHEFKHGYFKKSEPGLLSLVRRKDKRFGEIDKSEKLMLLQSQTLEMMLKVVERIKILSFQISEAKETFLKQRKIRYNLGAKVLIHTAMPKEQESMESLMKSLGFDASVSNCKLDVLERVKNRRYDILLLDRTVGKLFDLTLEAKKKSSLIFLIYDKILVDEWRELKSLGVDEFLLRPVFEEILIEKIKTHFRV